MRAGWPLIHQLKLMADGESAEADWSRSRIAALLAVLMTAARMPWPPLSDRLPLRAFECEDVWWHGNREAVRLFLLEWLARKVA